MGQSGGWETGEQDTLNDVLTRRLESDPDGPFLDLAGQTFSAAELHTAAARLAAALTEVGVGRGDRVASLVENGPAAVVTVFASTMLGAISVPINTAYKGDFLAHQLRDSGSSVLVAQGDLAHRAAEVVPDLSDLATVVVEGEPDAEISGATVLDWDEIQKGTGGAPMVSVAPWELATFIYTAGTTGPSKGCMLSHNYVVNLAQQIIRAWRRRPDDVVWTPLPMFHLNALATAVVGTLLLGGCSAIARKFSVSGFWGEIERTQATIASLLGTLAVLIANDVDRPEAKANSSLRLVAAAPMPVEIAKRFAERWGVETFSAGYGVTEASLLSTLPPGEVNPPNAAGKPNDVEFDVRIFDDHDNEVPVGEVGEIVCRPKRPHVMFEGYWGRPEATMAVSRNWWFHTGDFGRIDADGFLYFVDRKKDYLRRRGENISSFEMEKIFLGHDAIADVAVHSVPSPLGEDDVKVTAVLKEGATLTEEELCRWAIERVPYFAVPRYIEFRASLPRNPVGRVLKYRLREEGVTPQTWDAEAARVQFERR
ncbi:MAG: AMP-binding protein [Acidimicrobiales bacterium]|nr:AMP-binding protein [Acidimicrobiales bacterium]